MQEIWDQKIAPQVWNQYHNQLDVSLAFAKGGLLLDILDVGCAQGTLALKLAELGHHVTAIDIRQGFLDYAVSRYERGDISFICANVMELDLEQRFDLIFANQIIEHVVYPFELVKRLLHMLTPGGRLVAATPNCRYIKSGAPSFTELGEVAQYECRQFTADADGHFFAYTAEELKSIFVKAGLKNVRVDFFETPWISGHIKMRYLHPVAPVAFLKALDRVTLNIPWLNTRLAHQLLATGTKAA